MSMLSMLIPGFYFHKTMGVLKFSFTSYCILLPALVLLKMIRGQN